jgi:hypothetical protein
LLDHKTITQSKDRAKIDISLKKVAYGDRLSPPLQIKNYEYNPANQNAKVNLKKSISNLSSNLSEYDSKINNSFTTIPTKRTDKLEPIKNKAYMPNNKAKKDLIAIDLTKAKVVNRIKHCSTPELKDKKSQTKSPRFNANNKIILNSNANFNINGSTQIYVNQLAVDKDPKTKPILVNKPTKVVDDRKFSIMDIPGNVVTIYSNYLLT